MNLTEQYPSRLARQLLGFPRSLLFRTPPTRPTYGRRCCACSLTKEYITNQPEVPAPASQIAAPGLLHFRYRRTFCPASAPARPSSFRTGALCKATMPVRRATSSTERPDDCRARGPSEDGLRRGLELL